MAWFADNWRSIAIGCLVVGSAIAFGAMVARYRRDADYDEAERGRWGGDL